MNAPPAVHPLALSIPEMLRDEYVELVADIKAHGLKQPIVVFENQILDGRHRHNACIELGIEPRFETFVGTMDDAKAYVLSLNVHRRHLTFAQKQTIVAAELKRNPAQSDRAIAKKASVDHKTVAKVRATSAARGEIPHVETRTDTKGRQQPATKSKPTWRERQGMPPPAPQPPTAKAVAKAFGIPALAPIVERLEALGKCRAETMPREEGELADELEAVLRQLPPSTLSQSREQIDSIIGAVREHGSRHIARASPNEIALAMHRLRKLLATPPIDGVVADYAQATHVVESATLADLDKEIQAAIGNFLEARKEATARIGKLNKLHHSDHEDLMKHFSALCKAASRGLLAVEAIKRTKSQRSSAKGAHATAVAIEAAP